jgi:hypothetical protein
MEPLAEIARNAVREKQVRFLETLYISQLSLFILLLNVTPVRDRTGVTFNLIQI